MEGVAMETGQPIGDSNLQGIVQTSSSMMSVETTSGIGKSC